MKSKVELKSIKEANLAKRLIAVIIDGSLFAFLFVFLATVIMSPIANKQFDYENKQTKEVQFATSSHLYVVEEKNEEGNFVVIDPSEIENSNYQIYALNEYKNQSTDFYIERIRYYYLNFKTGNVTAPEGKPIDNYRAPDYNAPIIKEDGTKIDKTEYFTEAWFNEYIKDKKIAQLISDAMADFSQSSYIKDLEKSLKSTQVFIIVPSFVISYFVIFFTFPMIFKNGETIGKKMFKIGLVTKDGYNVKRRQIVFRQLILFVYVSLFSFIIGFEIWTTLASLGLGVAIYFLSTLISKQRRSFADFLAYTYLIDTNSSVWFEDCVEEENKEKIVENNLKKIKKPIENKNIIQIGSKIIEKNLPENRNKN